MNLFVRHVWPKKWFLFFTVVLVLSCCCMKIQIREDISATGYSDFKIIIEPLNVSQFGWDEKNPCDSFNASESSEVFSNARCSFDGKRETVSGTIDRKSIGGLTITGTNYKFDVVDALQGLFTDEDDKADINFKERNKTQLRMIKEQGVEEDYYVKMPGRITNVVGGVEQADGWVKFDLLDPELPERPYVESDLTALPLLDKVMPSANTEESQEEAGGEAAEGEENSGGWSSCCCCIPALQAVLALLGAAVIPK